MIQEALPRRSLLVCAKTLKRGKVTLHQEMDKGLEGKSGRQVAVIGGSASGFFTASLLARAGCSVDVIERAEQLDPTPRTLIVTSHMRTLLGEVGDRAVVNEIRKFELFTDGRKAHVPLDRPDLIIERSRLIQGLADEARKHGAKISFGNRFLSLQSNGTGLRVGVERMRDARTEELHADVVVGADGALSSRTIRRMAAPADRASSTGYRSHPGGHVSGYRARVVYSR